MLVCGQDVPSLIMGRAHVLVEDVDWFSWLDVRELPRLLEVLGAFDSVEVIRVGIAPAWGLNWTIWALGLCAPVGVIDQLHIVNVLARVAVPKGVLAKLLPPFTCEARERAAWLNCCFKLLNWACDVDGSEGDAVVVHGAGHKVVHGFGLVGEGALGSAVLVLELAFAGIVVVKVVAAEFAVGLAVEVRVDHDGGDFERAVSCHTAHVHLVGVLALHLTESIDEVLSVLAQLCDLLEDGIHVQVACADADR